MREIKFRGKSDTDWVYGHLLKVDDWNQAEHEHFDYFIQTDVMEQEEYNMYYITDNNTIGQFTGLHDKNGKEIYEGDILKLTNGGEIRIGKVIYEYSGFTIDVMNMNKPYGRVCFSMPERYIEVIDNIYDNPELLERSSNGD